MRSIIILSSIFIILTGPLTTHAQKISSDNAQLADAFNLAINTVDINVRRGVLAAGGDYGGEWTRDIAINSWNCASLLRPQVAANSLWSVTIKKDSIGHQYWDKIIWAVAANNHYKVTGDQAFIKAAYLCAKNTMKDLERSTYDEKYGLFMGPSVFNDGIAGYPESVYDSLNSSSLVTDHRRSKTIKCLSTNAVYYGAYIALTEMSTALKDGQKTLYEQKAEVLKAQILKHLYNEKESRFYYLIDSQGKTDDSQEALGLSFAVLFGILDPAQSAAVIRNAKLSPHGIWSISPAFARYNDKMPGRHNAVIWPMVNGFFADAALTTKNYQVFDSELNNLIHLALDENKGNYNFREIYNADSGVPDGGWQRRKTPKDIHWASFKNQTWSATAYLRMIFNGLLGLKFENDGLKIAPYLPAGVHSLSLSAIPYRNTMLNIAIKGKGSWVASFTINGVKQKQLKVSAAATGVQNILVNVE
jgi:glycogen debranching enzyme